MKILFAVSEAAPFLRTGDFGDFAAALPKALSCFPHAEVCVFLPYYKSIREDPTVSVRLVSRFQVQLSWRNQNCRLYRLTNRRHKLQFYFIGNDYYFDRTNCYGYKDDNERFAFFSKAILDSLPHLNWYPDIIHACNWQTAMIPVFLRALYSNSDRYNSIHTVFSICDIAHQGKADNHFVPDVLALPAGWYGTMHFDDGTNLLKAAIETADRLIAPSPTYAKQLKTPGCACGLHELIRHHSHKLTGILSGIDCDLFNPATDPLIVSNYSVENSSGKARCKEYLQKKLNLPCDAEIPMLVLVSSLFSSQGTDLLTQVMDTLVQKKLQMIVIGTGDSLYENLLRNYSALYPDKIFSAIVYDEQLMHEAYAAADMVLVPSRQESLGLSALAGMRYGAVPIVHETGALKDWISPYDPESCTGLGISFQSYNANDLLCAIDRGLALYSNKPQWDNLLIEDMSLDCSWKQTVNEYWQIYKNML